MILSGAQGETDVSNIIAKKELDDEIDEAHGSNTNYFLTSTIACIFLGSNNILSGVFTDSDSSCLPAGAIDQAIVFNVVFGLEMVILAIYSTCCSYPLNRKEDDLQKEFKLRSEVLLELQKIKIERAQQREIEMTKEMKVPDVLMKDLALMENSMLSPFDEKIYIARFWWFHNVLYVIGRALFYMVGGAIWVIGTNPNYLVCWLAPGGALSLENYQGVTILRACLMALGPPAWIAISYLTLTIFSLCGFEQPYLPPRFGYLWKFLREKLPDKAVDFVEAY